MEFEKSDHCFWKISNTIYGGDIFTCLEEIVDFCEIRSRLSAVKANNTGDLIAEMNILNRILRIAPEQITNSLHPVRCLKRVINFAVKDCLKIYILKLITEGQQSSPFEHLFREGIYFSVSALSLGNQ